MISQNIPHCRRIFNIELDRHRNIKPGFQISAVADEDETYNFYFLCLQINFWMVVHKQIITEQSLYHLIILYMYIRYFNDREIGGCTTAYNHVTKMSPYRGKMALFLTNSLLFDNDVSF